MHKAETEVVTWEFLEPDPVCTGVGKWRYKHANSLIQRHFSYQKNDVFLFGVKTLFIAITQYKYLNAVEIKQYIEIEQFIDYLIIRTPMETAELIDWIHLLNQSGFPKSKIIIHDNLTVLTRCKLRAIHFKEKDERIADFKYNHPDIQVSMSTHDTKHIAQAEALQLAFVLYGHIFKTNSKPNKHPRTENEINKALKFNIPIIALGGINTQTLKELPNGFKGIAGISIFAQQNVNEIKQLKEAWETYV